MLEKVRKAVVETAEAVAEGIRRDFKAKPRSPGDELAHQLGGLAVLAIFGWIGYKLGIERPTYIRDTRPPRF